MSTTYDLKLVVLSVLIATVASFSAFSMVERYRSASSKNKKIAWNLCGALVMGIGIWAMHFIGMLALKFPIPVTYDIPITILSIVPVIFAFSAVMWLMTLETFSHYRLLIGGLLLGSGIGLMHYIGMAAMRLNAVMVHDNTVVYFSILIAVILAIVALKIQHAAINQNQSEFINKKQLFSAIVMGSASSGMHYTAMTAVEFMPLTTNKVINGVSPITLALIVTVVVLVLLLLAILIPHLLRYKQIINTVNEDAIRLHAMMDTSLDAIIQMNGNGDIIGWSSRAQHIFGWTSNDALGQELAKLILPVQFRDSHRQALKRFLVTGEGASLGNIIEIEALHQDGHNIPIELTSSVITLSDGVEFNSIIRDISQRKQAKAKLILANKELAFQNQEKDKRAAELALAAIVFSHTREGIIITNASADIIKVNDTFTEVSGYSRQEAVGQNIHFIQSDKESPEFYALMWQTVDTKGYWVGTIWNRRKNGEVHPENLTLSAVTNTASEISHYVALYSDITQLNKTHQSQLQRMAHFDNLTNLPNRTLLADRLNQAILKSSQYDKLLAVTFLNLDGFKAINDIHGYHVGDDLLIAISLRMKKAIREGDTLSRIGGDEFVLVLTDLAKSDDCNRVLERLLLAASDPVTIGDLVLNLSASIGVTFYPKDGADSGILMRNANQAMYVAKQSGKNCYHLFDSADYDVVNRQQESLANIRAALTKREFVLYYQPKVNMSTGAMVGVEALIRWQHPVRGLVPPLDFLPIIENHAVSLDIGEWVIDTALSQISQWQSMGVKFPISVNISAYQLQQTDFVERLATILAAHPDVSPHLLELEVLETSALNDINYIIETMNACISLGVKFALDDFGTGYSSLTYLRRLPASVIKIDQTFIRDMLTDADDLAIVLAVVSLAKAFRIEVIAEGVETVEHGTALLELGCELAQGYGIARPMPASEVLTWLDSWKPDSAWLS
ncbi:EAL domain-containing protein [Colwellia sp. MB3u-4]|uniref:bifunctional diguanylate cyclase/phosphodiesterase n=1 Tax=Colwellia sp. MB3u-4 TaxID=2759822 RepID=UPI0015F70064|nr:EAL domain-containing protein [Colwellia sp. MB3u-4]MBA6289537.1 EAL domain-containing protein [Colwellia sp. MB3u-4]